ncbi:MAG: hypothetical protein IPP81_20220 [Chitinophagaceae bacterium]|nr:hypothetical protein [Chitinophagaceae bacterium]
MRHFLLILLASTNVLISCGQSNASKKEVKQEVQQEKPKGDRGIMNLKGDVESIVESTSRIEYSKAGDYNVDIKTTYVFDKNGNKIEFNSYTNNELMEKTIYQYNDKGKKIKEITSGLTDIFKYGNNDSLIEWSRFRDNKMEFTHIYTYDANGRIIKDESNDGPLATYSYDKNGIKTENNYFVWGKALNNRHDLKSRVTYKYNAKNLLTDRTHFTPPNPAIYQEEQNIEQSYKYDTKGNLIEEIENGVKHLYKYDVNGNQIEETGISAKGEIFYKYTYKYEYDTKMNWTKKTKFENGTQTSVFTRKINYFKS